MEKTLSSDERIRRAEEIYYKRKGQELNRKSAKVNVSNKKDFSLLKKMILQIMICIVIYAIFYMIQNTNYIFSEEVLKKTNEILSYDINIKKMYEQCREYINSFVNNKIENNNVHIINEIEQSDNNELQKENSIEENTEINNQILENENLVSETDENIGGENVEVNENQIAELTQMEQDAKDILETKSLIIPLKGTITSRFGPRNPETPTVPKNHTGIDIAVNEGTVFIAGMEGIVEKVSSERRFRKSFYNSK